MGTSVAMIDRTYGHLARDSEESIRERLDARADRVLALIWRPSERRESLSAQPRVPCGLRAMERTGIEPVTSGLQSRRSPS